MSGEYLTITSDDLDEYSDYVFDGYTIYPERAIAETARDGGLLGDDEMYEVMVLAAELLGSLNYRASGDTSPQDWAEDVDWFISEVEKLNAGDGR